MILARSISTLEKVQKQKDAESTESNLRKDLTTTEVAYNT